MSLPFSEIETFGLKVFRITHMFSIAEKMFCHFSIIVCSYATSSSLSPSLMVEILLLLFTVCQSVMIKWLQFNAFFVCCEENKKISDMKWKYCSSLCVCALILILTNKAACYIYHNQQHSHSVTAIFHFSRLKWCVRNCLRVSLCVMCVRTLLCGFSSLHSTISFFWSLVFLVDVILRVCWSFVSFLLAHTLTPIDSLPCVYRLGRRKITRFKPTR